MEDHLASMAARSSPSPSSAGKLRKAAEELVPMWLKRRRQESPGLISAMERAPDRFLDWKESARAGADMALSFVLSCTIADFVDKTLFVADPNPPPSDGDYMDDEEAEDVPEDDPAAGSTDAPPA
ncbi:hypothetical protein QYE76_061644 [Lolium multiflorum]|uniref:Uncharacterized protein n=1 Tax=Lolium multiflorum TaxID=4521 RepID=A0AAD8S208_LOLMU|nr:hypothetical protein QYE76_061644 [Lolium multiflorum]